MSDAESKGEAGAGSGAAFPDHFSGHSDVYARYRPSYPAAVFRWIGDQVVGAAGATAWDVGCGNGQASVALADVFGRVVATDASARQIEQAQQAPRVEYRVAPAERSGLDDGSVAAVTVAQALHWFDAAAFGAEVERVCVPGGVLVAITYGLFSSAPEIDEAVAHMYEHVVGSDWAPERRLVERGYVDIPLPGTPIDVPAFAHEAQWSLDDVFGYLDTWSAAQAYRRRTGRDARDEIRERLTDAWDAAATRVVRWPLTVVARRIG